MARLANSLGYELVKAEAEKAARIAKPRRHRSHHARSGVAAAGNAVTKDNNDAARALFERALRIDPNNAAALAGDAYTYMIDVVYGWTNPQTDYDEKIIAQADRALALAPDNWWAYDAKCSYLSIFRTARTRRSAAPTPVSPSIQIRPRSTRNEASPKLRSAASNKQSPIFGKRCGSVRAIRK